MIIEIIAVVALAFSIVSNVTSLYTIRKTRDLRDKILQFSAVQKLEYNPQICSACDRVVVKHVPLDTGGVICATCHNKKR